MVWLLHLAHSTAVFCPAFRIHHHWPALRISFVVLAHTLPEACPSCQMCGKFMECIGFRHLVEVLAYSSRCPVSLRSRLMEWQWWASGCRASPAPLLLHRSWLHSGPQHLCFLPVASFVYCPPDTPLLLFQLHTMPPACWSTVTEVLSDDALACDCIPCCPRRPAGIS